MSLPNHPNLPINLLAACFNNTVATYKFYWFLAVLQEVEAGNMRVDKRVLFARMLANAWYTVNYFRVSFGKFDLIQQTILQLKEIENLTVERKQEDIISVLVTSNNDITKSKLDHFNRNVPHWFLSPWFPGRSNESDHARKKRIYHSSAAFHNQCMYALCDDAIEVNPQWTDYLKLNSRMLKDFCYWNLALYLQSKNPNVPDIPNKLIKPAVRGSLVNQRDRFWDIVIKELGHVHCIYTGQKLTLGSYAVEHFIPYNFVSHDLIWNLIPADSNFNMSKSNKIPPLDKFFDPFFSMQKCAYEIISAKSPKNKFLEEYLTIFPTLGGNSDKKTIFNKEKFRDYLQPLVTIASNNGFELLQ